MEWALDALAQSDLAQYLRFSRWGYAGVNAAHILGIALLVGAITPLNLRLFGAWPRIPQQQLARVLVPAAASGLVLALTTGVLLFSTRPVEYVSLTILWLKMGLIGVGALSAIAAHLMHGWWLDSASRLQRVRIGAVSLICWLCALTAGRLIAFAGP